MDRIAVLIEQLVDAVETTQIYTEGFEVDGFVADRRTRDAVSLNLVVIGEICAKLLRDHGEFAVQNSQVPWAEMRGMRNRIAHGYNDIDFGVVWATITQDLPKVLTQLRSLS